MTVKHDTRNLLDDTRNATVTTVWGYVRTNAHSLDSDRACMIIQAAFDNATETISRRCEELSGTVDDLRRENRELRKKLKTLQDGEDCQ